MQSMASPNLSTSSIVRVRRKLGLVKLLFQLCDTSHESRDERVVGPFVRWHGCSQIGLNELADRALTTGAVANAPRSPFTESKR
jgi:hypothetical protein